MANFVSKKPPSPFITSIGGPRLVDKIITFEGLITKHGCRLAINLQSGHQVLGEQPVEMIPLHIDIRPNQNCIVRNSYDSSGWGHEERHGGCPIMIGKIFELMILIEHNRFRIAIDGNHFCDFNHRFPISNISYLYIYRDAKILSISMENTNQDSLNIPVPNMIYNDNDYPYLAPIQNNGLQFGQTIYIKGKTPWNAQRFNINIQLEFRNQPPNHANTPIALHFDVRFLANEIVRNHFDRGWYHEERQGGCPLRPGEAYVIEITAERAHYLIKINGHLYCKFQHRLDISSARHILIRGDTTLETVRCISAGH